MSSWGNLGASQCGHGPWAWLPHSNVFVWEKQSKMGNLRERGEKREKWKEEKKVYWEGEPWKAFLISCLLFVDLSWSVKWEDRRTVGWIDFNSCNSMWCPCCINICMITSCTHGQVNELSKAFEPFDGWKSGSIDLSFIAIHRKVTVQMFTDKVYHRMNYKVTNDRQRRTGKSFEWARDQAN